MRDRNSWSELQYDECGEWKKWPDDDAGLSLVGRRWRVLYENGDYSHVFGEGQQDDMSEHVLRLGIETMRMEQCQ